MGEREYLRIVNLRKGKLKPAEFRLRPGEQGLSLFLRSDSPGPVEVIAAVRAAGKQGDLAAAIISEDVLLGLGLHLVATPGGTPVPDVNLLYREARLPWWRRLLLRWQGRPTADFFNDHFVPALFKSARLLD